MSFNLVVSVKDTWRKR